MAWTRGNPSLRYEVSGGGPVTLVLLHEMGGSIASWDAVARLLARDFRIVRYDQRGSGLSEAPRGSLTLDDQIADLSQIIEVTAGDRPICLATIAASATIAAGYALTHPGRVSAAAFCAPALELGEALKPSTIERAHLVMRDGMRAILDTAMPRVYPEAVRGPDYESYRACFLAQDPVSFGQANLAFADAALDLERLELTCLLVAGGLDVRPISTVEAMAARLPDATLAIVERGGHILPHQAPDEVAALVSHFFASRLIADGLQINDDVNN